MAVYLSLNNMSILTLKRRVITSEARYIENFEGENREKNFCFSIFNGSLFFVRAKC